MGKFRALALSVMFLITIMMIGYSAHQFDRAEKMTLCYEECRSYYDSLVQCIEDEQAAPKECIKIEEEEYENICDGYGE